VCLLLCIITLGVCAAEQCAAPTLENGVVVAEQNLQLNTFTGTFQCNRGFILHGSRILKCRDGNWNYKFPICSAERVCLKENLPELSNGRARAERGMRGSVYRFQCNKGYKLAGPKTVYCTRQGWKLDSVPVCVAPRCDVSGMDQILYGKGWPELGGAMYRYECEDGASLVGEEVIVCDGKNWNGTQPQCFAKPGVPGLTVTVDGVPTNGQAVSVGQKVNVTCTARGGNPSPTLSILLDSEPVSTSLVMSMGHQVSYTFMAGRSKTSWAAACKAENQADDLPALSDMIVLSLNYAAENVRIVGKENFVEGEEAYYSCQSEKSNPASDVTLVVMDQNGEKVVTKETKMKKAVDDGFVSWSINSFKIGEGSRRLFMECRAVNQMGMAITDKIFDVKYPPYNVEITGPKHLLENETTILTCSAGESNPAVSITWFVSVDEKLIRLSEADIETVTEPSGYGWTVVSKAVVTGSLMDTLQVVCLAQIDSIVFKREARHTVDVHRLPGQLKMSIPHVLLKDEEATITCYAEGNPVPSTSITIASSATESVIIPVRTDGQSFSFLVTDVTAQVEATCTATNTAGSVKQSAYIPVMYPAQNVTITGPNYLIRGQQAVFSCNAIQGSPWSSLSLTSTTAQAIQISQEEISILVTDTTEQVMMTCAATNKAGTTSVDKHVTVYVEDDINQPVLKADSVENVDIQYGTDVVSRKRIVHITEAVVRGDLDKLVEDITAVKKVVLKYKTIDDEQWNESDIDMIGSRLSKIVDIPKFCEAYQFQMVFQGSAITEPVMVELDTVLGPADPKTTVLEQVPAVTELKISYDMSTAEVEWKQPACVSGYKYALYNLEDCPDEEEFQDCFVDFGLETVGYEESAGVVVIPLADLESCMEYVFMVKSFNSYGESGLVSHKFRTRETNNTDIDLHNFGTVGLQIPTLTQLKVVPGAESAAVSWVQPECFPEYEVQIVELDLCRDRKVENCVAEFSADIYDLTDEYENSYQFAVLDTCTDYVVMGRSTGDTRDGEVRAEQVSTLCTL